MSHEKNQYNFIQSTFLLKNNYKVFFQLYTCSTYYMQMLCPWYVLIHIYGKTYVEHPNCEK